MKLLKKVVKTEDNWFRVYNSNKLKNKPVSIEIEGIPVVIFRDGKGKVGALLDRCPHRYIPISNGWVEEGNIVCKFHGWHFDTEGVCKKISVIKGDNFEECDNQNATSFPILEKDNYIWVYCDNVKTDFPQINQNPTGVLESKLPKFTDPKFLSFIVNLLIISIIIIILVYTWLKFVPILLKVIV